MQYRFLVFICCALSLSTPSWAADHLVSGWGAPRAEYETCNRDLAKFEQLLLKHDLTPIGELRCQALADTPAVYHPVFRAISSSDVAVETVSGPVFSTLSYCQMELNRLERDLPTHDQLLEGSCKPMEDLYQPSLVVLTVL